MTANAMSVSGQSGLALIVEKDSSLADCFFVIYFPRVCSQMQSSEGVGSEKSLETQAAKEGQSGLLRVALSLDSRS